jgi:hypothetical protein
VNLRTRLAALEAKAKAAKPKPCGPFIVIIESADPPGPTAAADDAAEVPQAKGADPWPA